MMILLVNYVEAARWIMAMSLTVRLAVLAFAR
jgi:hypothetical protein